MSPKDLKDRFELIRSTGIDPKGIKPPVPVGLRTDLSMRFVQREKGGPYDWSLFDPVARAAKEQGTPVNAVLGYASGWAGKPECKETEVIRCAPEDVTGSGDFAKFAVAAVTRYAAQGIHTYELWNEPNTIARWNPGPSAAAYAQMVREVCPAIKDADPHAVVILGGLALGDKPGDIPMVDFVKRFYDAESSDCWDALSVHIYNPGPDTWPLLSAVRKVMTGHGDSRRIWLSEFGRETSGECGAAGNPSELQQAAELSEFIKNWHNPSHPGEEPKPWTGPLFLFMPRDVGTNRFGLTCLNGAPKPALGVYRNMVTNG
jgi:hypothetical protein